MFDFCVNGAGMVGSAVALGLLNQGFKVAVVETRMPTPFQSQQGPDLRVSAISLASIELLEKLGAWQHVLSMRARPYSGLSVWEQADSRTDFNASDIGLSQLGYFVENRILQLACHQALTHQNELTWYNDASIRTITRHKHHNEVVLSDGSQIACRWVIGADGAQSQVRRLVNLGVSGWQYQQQALGITIKTHTRVEDRTWQQFNPSGPRAFLPMFDNYGSIVWYDSEQRIKQLKALNHKQLREEIRAHFPSDLVDFDIIDLASFPLTRQHASQYVTDGVILIGDAAHTINPLAGQGVNLGFRDVDALLKVTANQNKDTLDSAAMLSALQGDYEKPRQRDNTLMMSAMDGFYSLFSNDNAIASLLRNTALKVAQHAGPIKHSVLRYAIGMTK